MKVWVALLAFFLSDSVYATDFTANSFLIRTTGEMPRSLGGHWNAHLLCRSSRQWAQSIATAHQPDMLQAVPQVAVAMLQQKLQLKKSEAEGAVRAALAQMQATSSTAQERITRLSSDLGKAEQEKAQAEADFNLIATLK